MREHILAEIRRIAAEQGGRAPGKRSFMRRTGIRSTGWCGLYWASWSDAVREAGLTPNDFHSRIEDSVILDRLAEACRHYGKFPTQSQLLLYRRGNPGLPNANTIGRRFGSMANARRCLSAWAAATGRYPDLAPLLARPRVRPEMPPAKERFVYLLRSGAYCKIGHSDDLGRRFKEIRVSLPEPLQIVHAIQTDDPRGIEAYWHKRFAERRAQGEWFKLTAADIAAFKRWKVQ